MENIQTLPPDDAADAADATWFDENPERTHRLRPPGAVEAEALHRLNRDGVPYVVLRRIGRDFWIKLGLTLHAPPPADGEQIAATVFAVEFGRAAA